MQRDIMLNNPRHSIAVSQTHRSCKDRNLTTPFINNAVKSGTFAPSSKIIN